MPAAFWISSFHLHGNTTEQERTEVMISTPGVQEVQVTGPKIGPEMLVHTLPCEKLAWMLQKMCETRYFEEKAEELYTRGLVHGTMHLSIGMEASPVGSIAALEPD